MILFSVISLLALLSSHYFGGLAYLQHKYNCSTLFDVDVNVYAAFAFVVLLVYILGIATLIRRKWHYAIASGLLTGGGLYHIYIRLIDGCVLDYFRLGSIYFNISDVLIVMALILLIIFSFISSEP